MAATSSSPTTFQESIAAIWTWRALTPASLILRQSAAGSERFNRIRRSLIAVGEATVGLGYYPSLKPRHLVSTNENLAIFKKGPQAGLQVSRKMPRSWGNVCRWCFIKMALMFWSLLRSRARLMDPEAKQQRRRVWRRQIQEHVIYLWRATGSSSFQKWKASSLPSSLQIA